MRTAALHGYLEVVKMLLKHGAEVNIEDPILRRPIRGALAGGHEAIVEELVQHGATINLSDEQYVMFGTPLQHAVAQGHTELVDLLLRRNADPNFEKGSLGNALQLAALTNNPKMLQILLGSSQEVSKEAYPAALREAILTGHQDSINVLLQPGAGKTVADFAITLKKTRSKETSIDMTGTGASPDLSANATVDWNGSAHHRTSTNNFEPVPMKRESGL